MNIEQPQQPDFPRPPDPIGPLAGDRVDAMFGFAKTPVVGYFASSRPKDAADRHRH